MEPQDTSSICFYRNSTGCKKAAVVHVFCKVEGRDTHFCQDDWQTWSRSVAGDELLAQHCPRCAPAYIARREAQATSAAITVADEPITGPLADAIEQAMHAAGILKPQRDEVLRRLAANTDAYVAAVMSRQSPGVVVLWPLAFTRVLTPIRARICVPFPEFARFRAPLKVQSVKPSKFACSTWFPRMETVKRRVKRPYA